MSKREPNVQPGFSLPEPFYPKACLLESAFLNYSLNGIKCSTFPESSSSF